MAYWLVYQIWSLVNSSDTSHIIAGRLEWPAWSGKEIRLVSSSQLVLRHLDVRLVWLKMHIPCTCGLVSVGTTNLTLPGLCVYWQCRHGLKHSHSGDLTDTRENHSVRIAKRRVERMLTLVRCKMYVAQHIYACSCSTPSFTCAKCYVYTCIDGDTLTCFVSYSITPHKAGIWSGSNWYRQKPRTSKVLTSLHFHEKENTADLV